MSAVVQGAKSWKTTAVGIIAAVMLILPQIQNVLDDDPSTVADWTAVIVAIAAAVGGTMARDGDKSSEAVGAK